MQVNLAMDHRYMPQIVSSAIVNAPPPEGVIKTLHLCSQAHTNVDKHTKVLPSSFCTADDFARRR